jgi:hypothetical protein
MLGISKMKRSLARTRPASAGRLELLRGIVDPNRMTPGFRHPGRKIRRTAAKFDDIHTHQRIRQGANFESGTWS